MRRSTLLGICCILLFASALGQGTVIITIPFCTSYLPDRTCATCADGYAPSSTRQSCNRCATGCMSCSGSINTCSKCYNGYYLSGSSCLSCSFGCSQCIAGSVCSKCNSGYYLNSFSSCNSCTSGCDVCYNSTDCEVCLSGFTRSNENGRNVCKVNAASIVVTLLILIVCCCVIVASIARCIRNTMSSSYVTEVHYVDDHRSSFIEVQPSYPQPYMNNPPSRPSFPHNPHNQGLPPGFGGPQPNYQPGFPPQPNNLPPGFGGPGMPPAHPGFNPGYTNPAQVQPVVYTHQPEVVYTHQPEVIVATAGPTVYVDPAPVVYQETVVEVHDEPIAVAVDFGVGGADVVIQDTVDDGY